MRQSDEEKLQFIGELWTMHRMHRRRFIQLVAGAAAAGAGPGPEAARRRQRRVRREPIRSRSGTLFSSTENTGRTVKCRLALGMACHWNRRFRVWRAKALTSPHGSRSPTMAKRRNGTATRSLASGRTGVRNASLRMATAMPACSMSRDRPTMSITARVTGTQANPATRIFARSGP